MSKDPAFLFYSSDFLTGTMFWSNEQVGLYVRMLCAQHQHGGRIDTNVLRTQCDGITNGHLVYAKFKHDEQGSYNERLQIEMEKRAAKSVKAALSVQKRWDKEKKSEQYERNTNVIRSENENENEIVIKNKVPTVEEFIAYANLSPDYEFTLTAKYEQWKSDGWMDGNGKKIKNWKTKLKSTIPYLRPFKQEQPQKINYLND
jgi:uncharacterized protein YdaU (DUF1376 family)